MANEIKFVFVGDTADFDKAIDSIVKKTNKIKDVDKDANKVRKQAVNLEKVLAGEYDKARKSAGSLTDITKKLAREETKRLEINQKLSNEALTQSQRQSLMVEKAKSEARTSGLKGAGVAKMGKLAAATIATAIAAGAAAAVKGTLSAIGEAQATRAGSLGAGQSIEQFQTSEFARSINRNPKEVGEAINSLGLIIDTDLNKKLTEAGDRLHIVSTMIKSRLVPIFGILAKKLSEFAVDIAAITATIKQQGVKKVVSEAATHTSTSGFVNLPLYVLRKGMESRGAKFGEGKEGFWNQFAENRAQIEKQISSMLGAATVDAAQGTSMKVFSDSLSRIGLFKTGGDSQIETMKKSLRQLEGIKRNTTDLKETVEKA